MNRIEQCMTVLEALTQTDYTVQWAVGQCKDTLREDIKMVDVRAALARLTYRGKVTVTGRFVSRIID